MVKLEKLYNCTNCSAPITLKAKTGYCQPCAAKLISSKVLHEYIKENGPWNKGKTKEDDIRIAEYTRKYVIAMKKIYQTTDLRSRVGRKGCVGYWAGKCRNTPAWNKGLTKDTDPRIKVPSTAWKKGDPSPLKGLTKENSERIKRQSEGAKVRFKQLWQDPEFVEKVHKGWKHSPTKPELVIIEFLVSQDLSSWKFVGDGSFWITSEGKHLNPDFINTSERKIVEYFGRYWHNEKDAEERVRLFAKAGWECLIIWEEELPNLLTIFPK